MNILFDHQTFVEQPYGGISRYIIELMKCINATPANQACLSLTYAENDYLPKINSTLSKLLQYSFLGKRQVLTELNKLYSRTQLEKQSFDVFHATYYDPYFLPHLGKKPCVVTFHDMIHEYYSPQYNLLGSDRRITRNKKLVADRATRLIAVSESTKRDLVSLLNIDPEKIQVIYHGCSFIARHKQSKSDQKPYLLYVGHRHAYKNFQAFIRAIASVLNEQDCLLLCAGGGDFTDEENLLIRSLGINKRILWRSIENDEMLQQFYENALAFVFPSLYEGFGMPILEAFASGCPCIVSNSSSLPEVAGDAALYMDPNDDESMHQVTNSIVSNSLLRSALTERGYQRSTLFSWQETAQQTLNLYEQCLVNC